jgi:hypothetical protein
MGTLNLIIVCLTLLISTISVIVGFIYNNYCLKKAEFLHKKEMEELRLGKLKEHAEIEILKSQLRKDIISEISEKSPEVLSEIKSFTSKVSEDEIIKIINNKFEHTLIEKMKLMEEKIEVLALKTNK